ncbi:MAG: lysophospholipid acyltransferase family protein [Tannerellaceae bacterium]|nr:lysophospholipid acyltransferase family protein [Tannerellaceae bacterium]
MKEKVGYALLYAGIMSIAWLPLRVLYGLSEGLYVWVRYVLRYRRKVVRENLAASFPEMSEKERLRIEKDFYHHFADYLVEAVKFAHIGKKEILQRAKLNNPEVVNGLFAAGHTCVVLLMVHYGNWEWFSASGELLEGKTYQIYKPLHNRAMDKLFIKLRERFGSYGMKRNDVFRDMVRIKQKGQRAAVIFLADQRPPLSAVHYRTSFLNQDTPMLTGAERIARKLDLPVVFLNTCKVKRGYYTVNFELLTDKPREMPENWITEQYAQRMEACIRRAPAYWLWTHNRWKHV